MTASAGEGAEQKGALHTAGANLGFSMEVPQRTKTELLYDPATPLLGARGKTKLLSWKQRQMIGSPGSSVPFKGIPSL